MRFDHGSSLLNSPLRGKLLATLSIDRLTKVASSVPDARCCLFHAEAASLRFPADSYDDVPKEKRPIILGPNSGETTAHPDLPDATDPALVAWLGSEMDEELLEVLHRYRARAKGYPPEQPRTNIDVAGLEEFHLAAFSELFEGTRSDDYLLAGNRYWTCIYLCRYTDCDCRKLRVAFFDDKAKPGSGDTVGSVLLDLGGAEDFEIVEIAAECGAPEHLIRELWVLFGRRHRVEAFLRRREAQAKALGATLYQPVAKPAQTAPQPGRNAPCPCGSGVKFKKCCLGKDSSINTR